MAFAAETLREIARMHDPVGVLSVYVNAAPQETALPHPLWAEQVRVALTHLPEGPDAGAVRSRLRALGPALERMLDPRTPGQGRALFAAVAGEDTHEVRIALPLVTDVRLQSHPHLLPLLAAVEDGRLVGLAVVSTSELRLLELEMGEGRDLSRLDVSQPGFEWSLRKEPNAGVVEDMHRIANIAAREVTRTAAARGWDDLVVAGNPRVARPLAVTLEEHGLSVHIEDTDPAPEVTATTIADLGRAHASASRRTREQQLVERVCAEAAAGGRGALGADDVVAALAEGRVDHLAIDARGVDPGTVAADAGDMIERAFETSAKVTVVNGSAAEALAAGGGVGALLRW